MSKETNKMSLEIKEIVKNGNHSIAILEQPIMLKPIVQDGNFFVDRDQLGILDKEVITVLKNSMTSTPSSRSK